MKWTRIILVSSILLLLLISIAVAQSGGGYDLSWFTIDGGGGSSSGGNYILSDTIGQPDAGFSTSGNYSLNGGFWGIKRGDAICLGDVNDDGKVDVEDVQLISVSIPSNCGDPQYNNRYDLDNDCDIDSADEQQVRVWWHKNTCNGG